MATRIRDFGGGGRVRHRIGVGAGLACALALRVASAATDAPDGFELILLDGYEDCPLAYRDLDADTYGGDSDVRIQCAPLPAGYVAIGGDCDDANPQVNPAALEAVPDAQFRDENCDGVDGNVTLAVFVAPAGSSAPECGTRELPCAIAVAPARALAQGRTQLYLRAGNHTGLAPLSGFAGGLHFYGGYDAAWVRAPLAVNASRIVGALNAQLGAVGAEFSSGVYTLNDLEVSSPAATLLLGDGSGGGSYGVRALAGTQLTITRSLIGAGAGRSGSAGSNGVSASTLPAQGGGNGGPGDEFNTICNDSSRGGRGGAGNNTCAGGRNPDGGLGGLGGLMDANCGGLGGICIGTDCNATAGTVGLDSAGVGGSGGPAGGPCNGGGTGDSGVALVDGVGGQSPVANGRGRVLAGPERWSGFQGNAGSLGDNGLGGGGGGGAGGCDDGVDSYGAGGGGGGAGGCRATVPGTGGRPGGASIAVFAVQALSVSITSTTLFTQGGGDGGPGGTSGSGQPGGDNGQGGPGPGGGPGGNGGTGGRGGHSGGGAGGTGGLSVGAFALGTPITLGGITPLIGSGGQGGAGGSGPRAGQTAPGGFSGTSLVCAVAGGC